MSNKVKQIACVAVFLAVAAVIMFFLKGQIDKAQTAPAPDSVHTENTDSSPVTTSPVTDSQNVQDVPDSNVPDDSGSTDTSQPDSFDDKVLKESDDAGEDYINKIIFIGDKTIYQMRMYTLDGFSNSHSQVWSTSDNISISKISSVNNFIYPDTLEAMSFVDAVKRKSPQYIILTFGSYNPDGILTKEELFSGMGNFIMSLKVASPNSHIIIQSVFPTVQGYKLTTAETVRMYNEWFKELCSVYNLAYLDTWSALADDEGLLKEEYYDTGGYLLNENGYNTVIKYIRTHAHPAFLQG